MKIKKKSLIQLFIIISILFLAVSASAQVTAIKAGLLIDPETGTAEKDQIIIVKGNRISSIGSRLKIPENAEVIDMSDMAVLPGLFDCHTHVCDIIPKAGNPHKLPLDKSSRL